MYIFYIFEKDALHNIQNHYKTRYKLLYKQELYDCCSMYYCQQGWFDWPCLLFDTHNPTTTSLELYPLCSSSANNKPL